MDFRFTEDQLLFADGVREFLEGTHGAEVLRRLDEHGNRDPAIWQSFVEMGLTGLLAGEDHNGMALGMIEGALIAAECGRACVAEPLVDTAFVAVPWLGMYGDMDVIPAIVAGERKFALSHPINPWTADGEGARLESVDPLRNLARPGVQTARDGKAADHLLNLGALMSAAQLVGLADGMLAQATEYAKVRTQFGQAIGAFQAIKHQLASCAVAIEFAKPVVWRAAYALQHGDASAPVHVSHAKLAATDAAFTTAETAIQVHGAMGYTYEVDLHFWMKRAWALGGAWGDRAFHLKRVDDAVIGGTLAIGPENTFA